MDRDRWDCVERLFHEALARPRESRQAFLREACQGDEELKRELVALLESQSKARSFLETSAVQVAARDLAASDYRTGKHDGQLAPGTIIAGRYMVLGLVGHGGMGE